ncbi:MAG: hypothetical protein QXH81_03520 [Thermofilaceae archaeon]
MQVAMAAGEVEYRKIWPEKGKRCVRVRIPREYWERIGSPRLVAVRVAGGGIILHPAGWKGGEEEEAGGGGGGGGAGSQA